MGCTSCYLAASSNLHLSYWIAMDNTSSETRIVLFTDLYIIMCPYTQFYIFDTRTSPGKCGEGMSNSHSRLECSFSMIYIASYLLHYSFRCMSCAIAGAYCGGGGREAGSLVAWLYQLGALVATSCSSGSIALLRVDRSVRC